MLGDGPNPCDIMILAGDRGSTDPLVIEHDVPGKALVPLAGVPLLGRVSQALASWPRLGRVAVVGPDQSAYRASVEPLTDLGIPVTWVGPSDSLRASIESALALPDHWMSESIIISADHGLLRQAWLDDLIGGLEHDHDMVVGMTSWELIQRAFPEARRTRYRFSDVTVCGGNLFAFNHDAMAPILALWSQVESHRKRPWRMLSMLGWRSVIQYALGRLSLAGAFDELSTRVGFRVGPVLIQDPVVGVDVDNAQDLALAEYILSQRRGE